VVDDPYVAAKDAQAIVILTEWPEFRSLNWKRLSQAIAMPLVVDARNILDPDVALRAGLTWVGVGKSPRENESTSVREHEYASKLA
jgi:UDPglucose 6-dehydrogenase